MLSDFIAIESVSTDTSRKAHMVGAAEFLARELRGLGFTVLLRQINDSAPFVIATLSQPGASETIGIYGHYDVQPEDPVVEWESPPFSLTLAKGKWYGRGVADDKGHIIQNLVALRELIAAKKLNRNIVCFFEGEEESGNKNLEAVLEGEDKDIFKRVDAWFVVDMGLSGSIEPQIFNGLRGIVYFELRIETGSRDTHSGVFGNRIYNPAQLLSELVASMKDSPTGRVKIPHFYEDIIPLGTQEYRSLVEQSDTEEDLLKRSGTYVLPTHWGPFHGLPANIPLALTSKLLPSLDIHGITSGYTDEGVKTVIPHRAMVKFSCRIVPGQRPERIASLIQEHIKQNLSPGVKYKLEIMESSEAFYTSIDDPWTLHTATKLEETFGKKTQFGRSGGSIPVARALQNHFGKPIVLTGFTLPDCNLHAPNENVDEKMFWKGIEALKRIYGDV